MNEEITSFESAKVTENRIQFIDVIKGLGILLVILGHCTESLSDPLNRFILTFHMPLFFFASGLVFSSTKKPFRKMVYSKFKSLVIPQLLLAFLGIIYEISTEVVLTHRETLLEVDYLGEILNWFLITMFLMDILLFFAHRFISTFLKNHHVGHLCFLLILCILFLICNIENISFIQQVLAASIFGELGFYLKPFFVGGGTTNFETKEYLCCSQC